jgi:hypothetical protein
MGGSLACPILTWKINDADYLRAGQYSFGSRKRKTMINESEDATNKDSHPLLKTTRRRTVVAIMILALWVASFTNPLHINLPSLLLPTLLFGFFAPSVSAGILLWDWAFGGSNTGTKPSDASPVFRKITYFAVLISLPVATFLLQMWLTLS